MGKRPTWKQLTLEVVDTSIIDTVLKQCGRDSQLLTQTNATQDLTECTRIIDIRSKATEVESVCDLEEILRNGCSATYWYMGLGNNMA